MYLSNFKKTISTITVLTLAVSFAAAPLAPAFAASKPAKPAKPAAPAAPKNVVVNPALLRSLLLHNNYGVMQQLNLVHQAKDQVNIARGNLLPRLNLGAIISGLTSGPAFALSGISFLLPFLLPSNWANLHQNEYLLESQKVGFRLMELNTFASAYTLYSTMLSDSGIRDVLAAQYNDLVTIRDWLVKQHKFFGNVPQEDIDRADAEVKLAYASISATDEMLIREKAALREMLALDLSANITLEGSHVPASPAEDLDLMKLTSKIQSVAPENTQMSFMEKAAEQSYWSKSFGFLTGGNLTVGTNTNGSPAFSKSTIGGGFNIGFDYCPTLDLASDNIANLRLHERELHAQQQQLAEATLGSVMEAKKQVQASTEAETELMGVFRAEFRKYTLGLTDLLHVLDAEKVASQATASKIKAQADVDALRITLHRELLTDQFASIPGCRIRPEAEAMDQDWLGQLFRSKSFSISMDQACAPAN